MYRPLKPLRALGAALVLTAPLAGWAADPVAGQAAFATTCSGCHAVASTAVRDRGRNSPAMISQAIAGVPAMGGLAGLSVAQREDIAAYLGNSPGVLAFPQTTVGATSAASSITVRSSDDFAIANLSATASGDFAVVSSGTCASGLAAGSTCTVDVAFDPSATGARTGTLQISHDGLTTPVTIALSGTGSAAPVPGLALSATSLSFSATALALPVTVTNSGTADLHVASVATGDPRFTLAGAATTPCGATPFTLPPGASCGWQVTWAGPSTLATESAALSVSSDASPATATVALDAVSTTSTGNGSNDGGGGCTLGSGTRAADPLLALMAALAAGVIWRRRRAR